ncbi:MAG: TolB protein [Solirubrobacteraceae bacterium]|jgi:Tol biopolymer transport system component|nr:TolB protein [Solirubrobacteraceae bacterium]
MRTTPMIAAVALLALAAPAGAAFPGANGPFVVSVNTPCTYAGGFDLVRIPWKGGTPTPLTDVCGPWDEETDDSAASFRQPDAAPDGQSVLARSSEATSRIVRVGIDGGAPTEIPLQQKLIDNGVSPTSFAPDGLHFAADSDRHVDGYDREGVYEIPLDGSDARVINDPADCARPRTCTVFQNPRWSPDGKLLAAEGSTPKYVKGEKGSHRSGIWLLRVSDGRPVRRVGPANATELDWSPDSRQLVYRTSYQQREIKGGASGGNVFVVRRDGTHRRALVHREDIAETQPTWSPDGKRVAWVALEFSAGDVGFSVKASLWSVGVRSGKRKKLQKLPRVYVEEGFYDTPELTWLTKTS